MGVYNIKGCFNLKHRSFPVLSILICLCRVGLEVITTVVTTLSLFTSNDSIEFKNYQIYSPVNVIYFSVLSSQEIFNRLQAQKMHQQANYRKLQVMLCIASIITLIVGFTIITLGMLNMETEAHIQKHITILNICSRSCKVAIIIVLFEIFPLTLFLFQNLFIVLVISLHGHLHSFNKHVGQKVITEKNPQNIKVLSEFEKKHGDLAEILEHLNKLFSFYLGFNIFVWMFMICQVIYISMTTTAGYFIYIISTYWCYLQPLSAVHL